MCRHQVRKILDLVQSKGEEVSEFLLYVLQRLADAYVDLRPWLLEIGFSPSQLIQSKTVVNTDPGMSPRGRVCVWGGVGGWWGWTADTKHTARVWKGCREKAQEDRKLVHHGQPCLPARVLCSL